MDGGVVCGVAGVVGGVYGWMGACGERTVVGGADAERGGCGGRAVDEGVAEGGGGDGVDSVEGSVIQYLGGDRQYTCFCFFLRGFVCTFFVLLCVSVCTLKRSNQLRMK